MQQDEQVSRYEVNRNVRMVLIRHDADLTRIDYSFIGNTVYFYGDLVKPTMDFSVQEIEVLAREISALPHVREIQFHFNNWTVASSGDSWQVIRTKKRSAATVGAAYQAGSSGDSTIVVEKAEKLINVLKDIEKASKKEKEENVTGPAPPK